MEDPLTLQWFDEDFYLLIMRLAINMVFITILIRFLYYEKTRRKDYLFTYYLIGTITFFLCFGLKKLDIEVKWKGKGINEKALDKKNNIIIECSKKYFRPSEVDSLLGDASKAKKKLKWFPKTSLNQLIDEMIDYELENKNN